MGWSGQGSKPSRSGRKQSMDVREGAGTRSNMGRRSDLRQVEGEGCIYPFDSRGNRGTECRTDLVKVRDRFMHGVHTQEHRFLVGAQE